MGIPVSRLRILWGLCLSLGLCPAQQYVISTIAGGAPPLTPARGFTTPIGSPSVVATDSEGNVYIASSSLSCVFKLDQNDVLTLFAGNSRSGHSGDGGLATNAQLSYL